MHFRTVLAVCLLTLLLVGVGNAALPGPIWLGMTTCTTVGTTNEVMPALRNYTNSPMCEGEGAYFIVGLHAND